MSAITQHLDSEALGRRYKKYEAAYNAQFAADPDPANRKFQEYDMPKIQQERLEIFRGNDRDARAAHLSNPADPLTKPTPKEAKMWEINQKDHWQIDRAPTEYVDHPHSKNKWLPPMTGDKDQTNAYFENVEAKHGAGYDAYAAKAGSNAVSRDQYLSTMAVVEFEGMKRGAQQTQQQAPAQQSPVQEQPEPAKRSRLSVANFQGTPEAYIDERVKAMESKSDGELEQVKATAQAEHAAMGRGPIEQEAPKVAAWNDYKAREAHAEEARAQEVLVDTQTQRRTRQQ